MHTGFWRGNLRGKRPLGRPIYRQKDNIKMDIQEMRWGRMTWMDLAQDRDRWQGLVDTVINLWVP